jgi:metal-responsive CopG/Arc/MetJ family transcriptional regulator
MIAHETTQVNIRMPEKLIVLIDRAAIEYHFTNRQELVKCAFENI